MRKNNPFFITEGIDTGRKNFSDWVEESFNPGASFSSDSTHSFLTPSLPIKKIRILFFVIIFGLALLLGRSFYLQVLNGSYYFSLAENNRIRIKNIQAQRGIIYDRNGKILVKNISGFSLLITQADLSKDQFQKTEVLRKTSELAGIPLAEIEERLNKADKYFWQPIVVKTGIDYEKAMALKIASIDLPGISLEDDSWRQYLFSNSLSHLMGYVGKISTEEYEDNKSGYLLSDNIGKTGLEKYYENLLRGKNGIKKIEVDSLGREKKIIAQEEPVNGSNLVLTIDADLEEKIYQTFKEALGKKYNAVAVVSNPQTGEILALVDYPSYDNNLFATGISQQDYNNLLNDEKKPLFFRAISGEYPSGSTIKPVIALAALQEKVVDKNTSFNSVGGIWVGSKWFFPDWNPGGHGITNVIKALALSVNTYFYYVGGGYGNFNGLGVDLIDKYLNLFNLGQKTGIDLPAEKSGLVPTPAWKEENKKEQWYIGDTYHLAIGQGDLLVTPLQVNSWTATISAGGAIYRPHLVKEIVNPDGRKELIAPIVVKSGIADRKNIDIVREGMRQAVLAGSARGISGLPVTAGGKTGTAQWNEKKNNHAWFTAFAPFDQPSFCITILVEEGGEGSSIAVPIAREVMNYWFTRQN
ncbi:MAG: penicillin-binding protein 2 [Patescibacteria group bacterium]